MPQVALEPGAYPPKHKLQPVKGADGLWRLPEVRHRAFSGLYVRTSGIGTTKKDCLADWERKFQKNRCKGSVVAYALDDDREFTLMDKMSDVFVRYVDEQQQRVTAGKLKAQSLRDYKNAIYPTDSARASDKAIKLDQELGNLAIGEVGKPRFLNRYLRAVAKHSPSMAARHHLILTAVFASLTLDGLFDDSPMRLVPNPYAGGGKQRALNSDERVMLLDLVVSSPRRPKDSAYLLPFTLALLGTGVRPSEGLAFRWLDCLDLDDETVGRAVLHVCGTVVRLDGQKPFRQDHRKKGDSYFVTLPTWLTSELRVWKRFCAPTDEADLMFTHKGGVVDPDNPGYCLDRIRKNTALKWLSWGNLRDTVATEVTGKTGNSKRASAQLGHSEGSSMATRHYIDRSGYVRKAVDNADALEGLYPAESDGKVTILDRVLNSSAL
ncbi:tyrosine-type recombinase/integrase [Nocardia sp. NPDC004573]